MCTGTHAVLLALIASLGVSADAADVGNRLTYLDDFCNPYHVGLATPKLVTPQWVGQEGVEAVIVLAIDDMTDSARYEAFLRPILDRLEEIDGRASMSIMTKQVDPHDPQLQRWLQEGLSIEVHTVDHPCPCLQKAKSQESRDKSGKDAGTALLPLAAAKDTFDRCVDLLATVPGNRPVAFRMPCCDSMDSVSPRFFLEVFNKATPAGRFLAIDSSVFQIFSGKDPDLPRGLAFDRDGHERFRKYVPTDRPMVNLIEDYAYPYVIGRLCWEVPCLMPSDWDAQNLNGKCSPVTLGDLKRAVDAVVVKRGIFSLCFHPHGWIAAEQVAEMVDYADRTYGGKIRFLSFAEVNRRLNENLLGGHPLRNASGGDNGVRVLDLDNDGYMDAVIGNPSTRQTRVWRPDESRWQIGDFPTALVDDNGQRAGVRFAVLEKSGAATLLSVFGQDRDDHGSRVWHFDGTKWVVDPLGEAGLMISVPRLSMDGGIRARDLDGDGTCELIVGNSIQQQIFAWSAKRRWWRLLPFSLPEGTAIVDAEGRDAGLRFVDVNEDGAADVLFSNAERYSLHLFTSMTEGWSRNVLSGRRPEDEKIPAIVRADGTNNGAWFNYGHMWVENEDTGKVLPDEVDRRTFAELLGAKPEPPLRSPASSMRSP